MAFVQPPTSRQERVELEAEATAASVVVSLHRPLWTGGDDTTDAPRFPDRERFPVSPRLFPILEHHAERDGRGGDVTAAPDAELGQH